MAAWTLSEAREFLRIWLEAEIAISTSQQYRIGTRELTRANLSEVTDRINFWRNEVARLEAGRSRGARVIRVVPRDL